MKTTFQFLARTGRRIRSYLGKLIKPLAKNGRFTIKLTLAVPLVAKVEIGAEWSSNKPR
ncbi:trans-acting factor B [Aureimonas altamirensis]|uniref:trans-acting factor B n=1 Tax=Aureimonas altamirensis TaxID=370622 RepID=UPI00255506AF|nr:trans-acting factor B [Aureimonas altamirensis]